MINKILVAAPTSVHKKYCFEDWLNHNINLSHLNYKILLTDNSNDGGIFCNWMNAVFKREYGLKNSKFTAVHSKTDAIKNINERMALSCNDIRDYAIIKGYSHVCFIETDIFPEPNIIEELLYHNKKVIGALYDRDEGRFRKLCIQKRIQIAPKNIRVMNLCDINENHDIEVGLVDGSVKEVASVGLGCVLISIDVLKKIRFRFDPNKIDFAPDAHFSEDCFKNGIKIFSHTGQVCIHKNDPNFWYDTLKKQ